MSRPSTLDLYVKIIRLGLPILVGQLGMIVVGFVDTTMVGRYSTEALASASFVNGLFNTAIFACVGFTYGLTPLVGALYAQKRRADAGAMLRAGLLVNVAFSLLVSLVMFAIYLNLDRMGQPEELLPLIRPYFVIYLFGIIPVSVFNVFAQWAYAINRTRMPMWITLASNVVNIIGNYALIYGHWGAPELGLTGAGISTLAARVFCPLVIAGVFFFKSDYALYRAGFRSAGADRRRIGQLNRTSWPVAMQMSFESGSFTAAAVMAGWLGAIPLAAYQVVVITGTLGFCVYYSMAAAVAVLVANAAGLSDRGLMRRTAFAGYRILLALAALASLTFIFLGPQIMRVFSEDPIVIACALTLIVPLVVYQLGDATQISFANALRGTGNVMPMLWISFVSYVIIGIPATYILAFPAGLGIYGIILSFSVSLFAAAAMFLYFFMRTTAGGRKKC